MASVPSALVYACGATIAAAALSIAWSWHVSSQSAHTSDAIPTPLSTKAYSPLDANAGEDYTIGSDDERQRQRYILYPRTANWTVRLSIISCITLAAANHLLAAYSKRSTFAEDLDVIVAICQCVSVYFESHNCLLTTFTTTTSARLSWLPFHLSACLYYLYRLYTTSTPPALFLQLTPISAFATLALTLARAVLPRLTKGVLRTHRPPPELTSGLLAYFTFSYMNRDIMDLLTTQDGLSIEEVPGLCDNDCSDFSLSETAGAEAVTEAELARRMYRRVKDDLHVQFVLQVMGSMLNYVPPLCMHVVLAYISGSSSSSDSSTINNALLASFMLFFAPFVQSVVNGQNYVRGRHVALGVRGTIMTLLYNKLLSIDLPQLKDQGMINNGISADLNEIQEFCVYIHFVWCSLFEMTLCIAVLFQVLGIAAVAGVMVTLLTLPLGYYGSRRLGVFQKIVLGEKDARMDAVSEILLGTRIIKWYYWERNFLDKILAVRGRELFALRRYVFTDGALRATYDLIPAAVGLASFMVHTLVLGRQLNTSVGFTSLLLFSLLNGPMQTLSDMISRGVNARLSLSRIASLLNAPNVQGLLSVMHSNEVRVSDTEEKCHVRFEGVSLAFIAPVDIEEQVHAASNSSTSSSYSQLPSSDIEMAQLGLTEDSSECDSTPAGARTVVLRDVSFALKEGSLVAVCGATGSGKSTLLLGMIGECPIIAGRVSVARSSVSYVAQTSWIQNDTIRNNVLFGSAYDAERYRAVLSACALDPDLLQMPYGDETEIGERGINISGGQQQRVNLARAAYSSSSLILLDDPLSAVDSHSADHIFQQLIVGLLRNEGRTVVLVTHALSLVLPFADSVIVLNEQTRRMEVFCRPEDLGAALGSASSMGNSTFFSLLVDAAKGAEGSSSGNSSGTAEMHSECVTEGKHAGEEGKHAGEVGGFPVRGGVSVSEKDGVSGKDEFVATEQKAVGMIQMGVYWFYLQSCGKHAVLVLVVANLLFPLAVLLQNYSLAAWIREVEASLSSGPGLRTYLLCLLLVLASTLFKYYYHAICSLRAARSIHSRMTRALLLARMAWHDSQPTGRKMNRFSQDVSTLDGSVMNRLREFMEYVIGTFQIVGMISATLPVLLVCLLPVLYYTDFVSRRYIKASRELKRLESVYKSPVFVHFSETMSGVATIRCFRRQDMFMRRLFSFVDRMNACHFYNWASNRWLNCRTQALGALVSGLVSFCLVIGVGGVTPTLSAIILLYSQQFTENITFLTRTHAECQNAMNSVERIQEYCQVESEDYYPRDSISGSSAMGNNDDGGVDEVDACSSFLPAVKSPWVPHDWPVSGRIEFDRIRLAYRPTEPDILKDVSFVADSGMKIGIVGRSGAGKSSLLAALFRTVEPTAGRLLIDGVDVLLIGLGELRSNLAIVPQEPVLFKGSVRSNLDPFAEHSEQVLLEALAKVKLSSFVASLPGSSLEDKVVSERGANLSLGQRQLMCLCRALLRRPKMLILDEATASVDAEADACLQETIKTEFSHCTVLSIAHRLKTVAYFDKIMVMDAGRVTEFATPLQLLADAGSVFYKMCERSGDLQSIIEIAVAAAKKGSSSNSSPMQ